MEPITVYVPVKGTEGFALERRPQWLHPKTGHFFTPSELEERDAKYGELANAMTEISKWGGKYEISFQFWGVGNNNVYIAKDGVDLYSSGGFDTPLKSVKKAIEYIHKINRIKK